VKGVAAPVNSNVSRLQLVMDRTLTHGQKTKIGNHCRKRGPMCHECGPIHLCELKRSDEGRGRHCIREGRRLLAMEELRVATVFSLPLGVNLGHPRGRPKRRRNLLHVLRRMFITTLLGNSAFCSRDCTTAKTFTPCRRITFVGTGAGQRTR